MANDFEVLMDEIVDGLQDELDRLQHRYDRLWKKYVRQQVKLSIARASKRSSPCQPHLSAHKNSASET